jgi:hypothetical protein
VDRKSEDQASISCLVASIASYIITPRVRGTSKKVEIFQSLCANIMGSGFRPFGSAEDDYKKHIVGDPKSTILQIAISVVLGLSAFIAFCVS